MKRLIANENLSIEEHLKQYFDNGYKFYYLKGDNYSAEYDTLFVCPNLQDLKNEIIENEIDCALSYAKNDEIYDKVKNEINKCSSVQQLNEILKSNGTSYIDYYYYPDDYDMSTYRLKCGTFNSFDEFLDCCLNNARDKLETNVNNEYIVYKKGDQLAKY